MKYPRQLSAGANNAVIALSDIEVAKLYTGDTRSDIGSEAEKMRFANSINELVVKLFGWITMRVYRLKCCGAARAVMERIRPIDYRAYEIERRELWYDVFADDLDQLHRAGFVHRDLRPGRRTETILSRRLAFDNILLTEQGLRLIDVGISALKTQVGDRIFDKYLEIEREELAQFRDYFLNW